MLFWKPHRLHKSRLQNLTSEVIQLKYHPLESLLKRGRLLVSLTSFKWAALSNGSGLRCEILFIAVNLAAAEASPSMLLTWSSYFFFRDKVSLAVTFL